MPLYFDEALEVVKGFGLDWAVKAQWVKIPADAGRGQPKVYLQRPDREGTVGQVHVSAFTVADPAVEAASGNGAVRGIIWPDRHEDAAVLRSLVAVLTELVRLLGTKAADVAAPEEPEEAGEPAPELTAISLSTAEAESWMRTRIGYGNREARGWFFGMEEACKDSSELPARLKGEPVEDLVVALRRIGGYDDLVSERPRLQRTWAPLIRTWLVATSADGVAPSVEELRAYQRDKWGRRGADHLLAELLPLPSPSLADWPYASIGLPTRKEYEARWLQQRIALLRSTWASARTRPLVAIAYGARYWPHYRAVFRLGELAGEAIWPEDPDWARGFRLADDLAVALVRHAVAYGSRNRQWEALGQWLRRFLHASAA